MAMKNPVHPGLIVRHDCIEPLNLTVTAAAKALGVTRQALNLTTSHRPARTRTKSRCAASTSRVNWHCDQPSTATICKDTWHWNNHGGKRSCNHAGAQPVELLRYRQRRKRQ